MTFDPIIPENLWSVRFDGCTDNAFSQVFNQWSNPEWLRSFFFQNKKDLDDHFRITNVDRVIYETITEADILQSLILNLAIDSNLDLIFKPLEPMRSNDVLLGKEKAKSKSLSHPSWLRLYAIKAGEGTYIITGGAIKLTATMKERAHTLEELQKMEKVRNYLISEGIVDSEGFIDFLQA